MTAGEAIPQISRAGGVGKVRVVFAARVAEGAQIAPSTRFSARAASNLAAQRGGGEGAQLVVSVHGFWSRRNRRRPICKERMEQV
jgi:hypothetical protein